MFPFSVNQKDQVSQILAQDWFYRKQKSWPLISFSELGKCHAYHTEQSNNNLAMVKRGDLTKQFTYMETVNFIKEIYEIFPALKTIFEKYKGKILVAGGSLIRILFDKVEIETDCDLFFYNSSKEEAEAIILDCIELIGKSVDMQKIYLHRKLYVTTVNVRDSPNDEFSGHLYQFIHRIYPTKDSIIGGFDLGPSMILFDGDDIFLTPLGAYSIQNECLIVDTSRRSTSFEYRIEKYFTLGFNIIFPGISETKFLKLTNPLNDEELKRTGEIAYEVLRNMGLTVSHISYNPNGDFESIAREIRLPKFKIGKTTLYNAYIKIKEEVSESTLKKYTDYGSSNIFLWDRIRLLNLNYLISGDLEGVTLQTLINPEDLSTLKDLLFKRKDIKDTDSLIKIYQNQVYNYLAYWESYMNKYQLSRRSTNKEIKLFAEYVPRVRKIQKKMHEMLNIIYTLHDENQIEKLKYDINTQVNKLKLLVDTMTERIKYHHDLIFEKLQNFHFIEQDPQRQWTSSINPIVKNPREFYGDLYESCWIGIPLEIETTLRLIRNFGSSNWLKILPKDLFNMILFYLFRAYVFNPLQEETKAREPKLNLNIDFEEPINIFYGLARRKPHYYGTLKYHLQNLDNKPDPNESSPDISEDDLEN